MIELQRGMRGKLADHVNCSDMIEAVVSVSGGDVYDYTCFGLDTSSKLSDDRYMLFYNQTNSPNNEIQLRQAADGAHFQIRLSALPPTIHKLVFTVSIDGNGTMAMINKHTFTISQGSTQHLALHMTGKDFHAEKAIISVELYRKDGIWRFAAVANGFNGGLPDLLKFYGGEEVSSQSSAPQPVKPVAPSVQTDNHTVPEPSMTGNEIYSHLNFGSNTFSGFFDGVIEELCDLEIDGENVYDTFSLILDDFYNTIKKMSPSKVYDKILIDVRDRRERVESKFILKFSNANSSWSLSKSSRPNDYQSFVKKLNAIREYLDLPRENLTVVLLEDLQKTMEWYIQQYDAIPNQKEYDQFVEKFGKHSEYIYDDFCQKLVHVSNLVQNIKNNTGVTTKCVMALLENAFISRACIDERSWFDLIDEWRIVKKYRSKLKYDFESNDVGVGTIILTCVPFVQLGAIPAWTKQADAAFVLQQWRESVDLYYYIIWKILITYAEFFMYDRSIDIALFSDTEDNFFDEL